MASGTITLKTVGKLDGRIIWSATANPTSNSSKVTAYIQVRKNNNATIATSGAWKYTIKIGNKTFSGSATKDVISDWVTIYTIPAASAIEIAHNSDGAGSVKISGSVTAPANTSLADTTVKGDSTVTLDTIIRKATIVSATNFDDEGIDEPIVKWNNPMGDKVTIDVGIFWDEKNSLIPYKTVSSSATSYTFEITEDIQKEIYAKLTDTAEKTVYYYVRTTLSDGTTRYHSSIAKTLTILNPEPTFEGVIKVDNATKALTGSDARWIKGYTNILYGFKDINWTKGATSKMCMAINGTNKVYGEFKVENDGTPQGVLESVEADITGLYITNSRGYSAPYVIKADALIEYIDLTCNITNTKMEIITGADGNSTLKAIITIEGNLFTGSFDGTKNNTVLLSCGYKADGAQEFTEQTVLEEITIDKTKNRYKATTTITGLDYQKEYTFRASAMDLFNAAHINFVYSKEVKDMGKPIFDWSDSDFNFNVPVTINGLEFQKLINALTASTKLTVSTSAGTGYSGLSCEAYLIGNMIRFSFSATRSAAVTGNIENEKVMTITVNHGGKIQTSFNTSFSTGATGAVSALYTTNMVKTTGTDGKETGTGFSFDINLAATATASTSFGGFFYMPVTLNLNNF